MRRLLSLLIGVSLVASACSGFGNGASRESLIAVLEVEAELSTEDATCVADALYATVGLDEGKINKFSTISSVEEGNEDFAAFELYQSAVDTAVRRCVS